MRRAWRAGLALAACGCALLEPVAADAAHIVVDAATGEVLAADDAVAPWRPASLTKMMTVYLALEGLQLGVMEPTDRIVVSSHAAAQPPTRLGLSAGSTILIGEAIEAIIVRSANDAAAAIADAMGGSEEAFGEMMTAKARELGMTGTVFRNATGLPNPDQITTARDMAVLARALIRDFPLYYDVFATRSINFRGRTLPTYNGLLVTYPGADGLKTGFTCASGYNVVTSAQRGGRRLIAVVLGSKSRNARSTQMRELLNVSFGIDPDKVEGPELQEFGSDAEEEPGDAPQVLSQNECGRHPETLVVRGAPGKIVTGGWGVTLGAFGSQKEAQARLAKARAQVGSSLQRARATLVETRAGKMRRFAAMFTNLSHADAASTCRQLQKTKLYCVALGPQTLKNPRARFW